MSKKEAATSVMAIAGTFFLKSKSFCSLFDSDATHSFISIRSTMQLKLENMKSETNHGIKLSNDSIVECPISYKLVPIAIGGVTLPGDLIEFSLLDFNIILGKNWLHTYGAKIDSGTLKVILRNESGREVCFYGQREEKPCPIISAMKASKLLCQGCTRYWCYAMDTQSKGEDVEDIHAVSYTHLTLPTKRIV